MTYDFYTLDSNLHFAQEEMTEEEAKEYAHQFQLRFEPVNH